MRPYSRADAPYFRSPGFYVRVGGLAIVIGGAICVLVLRAWSIQVLHGKQYTSQASAQSFRLVDIPAPRGAIVDSRGRVLAETAGQVVVVADVAGLGTLDRTGWHATKTGSAALRKLSRLSHVPVSTLVVRIRRSVIRSPFTPAVVLPHRPRTRRLPVRARSGVSGLQGGVAADAAVPAGLDGQRVSRPPR